MRAICLGAIGSLLLTASLGFAQPGSEVPVPLQDQGKLVPADQCCAQSCCFDDCCVTSPRVYASAEYLLWWVRSAPLGAPIATGDRNNSPFEPPGHINTAGGLADPDTVVLLGDSHLNYDAFSGGRFGLGVLLGDGVGIEASGFFLGRQARSETVGSNDGSLFIFRPVFDTQTGNPNAGEFISLQDNFKGFVTVTTSTELWGAEANFVGVLRDDPGLRLEGLVGFRTLQMQESLGIVGSSTLIPPFGNVFGQTFGTSTLTNFGDTVVTTESFRTHNEFYGGQIGLRAETQFGRLLLEATTKVGLGDTHEALQISGNTAAAFATGGTAVLPGALLAVASNIGRFTQNEFAVVPEVELKIGYELTRNIRAFVGYDFMYWSNVARPGDQLNVAVNTIQSPVILNFGQPQVGPIAPIVNSLKTTDFWAQGLTFGLEFRF
jgi:Putative beta barrel porin-7 (BBP7)